MTDQQNSSIPDTPEAVLAALRVSGGVKDDERGLVEATLNQLAKRLARIAPASLDLELSVKDRGQKGQKTTLEVWLPGQNKLVGTSELEQLKDALNEAEAALLAQISGLDKQHPAHNKHQRDTIRG